MNTFSINIRLATFLGIALVISACSVGSVNVKHKALQNITPDTPVANVYIIRPRMLKLKGASRNVLQVSLNGETLMDIGAGEYTLVKILPGQARVATHSMSNFTNKREPIPVSRYRDYNFIENMTYFIHLFRVDEEFRGVFFDPRSINLRTAKTFLYNMSAFGAAKDAPLESLKHVDQPTPPSEMPIALPESLYPGEKYLLTPKPFK